MQFLNSKNKDGWNVSPTTGKFQDQTVAQCDSVNLQGVRFIGKAMIGTIRALWGTVILQEDVYGDQYTLRGLKLDGVFDTNVRELMEADFDGYNNRADRLCRMAQRVLAIGHNVYARGAM